MKSQPKSEPIHELTISETRTETDSYSLTARLNEGKLVLEGYDIGEAPKRFVGDIDYEYWLSVEPDYVPAVLLWLIKERFTTTSQFEEWLDAKGIPSEFFSY